GGRRRARGAGSVRRGRTRIHRRDRAPAGEPPHPRRRHRARATVAGRRVPARHWPAPGGRAGAGAVNEILLLGRRAVREVVRLPAATVPTLFIPLFFLAVNIGQVSKTFPSSTPFLHGQGYVGFQVPVSLLFAVCTATSGLALVTEIENGYFDKLLVAPIRRQSIIFGRLTADLVRGVGTSTIVLLVGLALGVHVEAGVLGAVVLVALSALWGAAYAGLAILIGLYTRS